MSALDLNRCHVLVTGGTGSFGKKFVETVYRKYPKVARVVIFSRDELKQFEMAQLYQDKLASIRFFIGDVRDKDLQLWISRCKIEHQISHRTRARNCSYTEACP